MDKMTGSVPNDTHTAASAGKTEKADKLRRTAIKNAYQCRHPTPTTHQHRSKDSKKLLPPVSTSRAPLVAATHAGHSSHRQNKSQRHPPPFGRSASSPTRTRRMEESALSGKLASQGRAQSLHALHRHPDNAPTNSAKSEVCGPVTSRRIVDESGSMKRAKSYSSLAMRSGTAFRSANSTRPPPAPPRTTTDLDFCRHPVAGSSRVARCRTPRGNNPHPVGLHFQSPYNRDGKVNSATLCM